MCFCVRMTVDLSRGKVGQICSRPGFIVGVLDQLIPKYQVEDCFFGRVKLARGAED